MKIRAQFILASVLGLAIAASSFAAIELRLKNGTRWRGDVGQNVSLTVVEQGVAVKHEGKIVSAADLYLVIETSIAGKLQKKTIFKSDITAIQTAGDEKPAKSAEPDETSGNADIVKPAAADKSASSGDKKEKAYLKSPKPGVFVLPLEGQVGLLVRHQEMLAIAKEADKYGPGQIIVLLIDSPGGAVTEMEKIHSTLVEIKKRHRLVAWIREAISAACATAMHCDEIYFMTEGSAGAMTAFAGDKAWDGEELERWLRVAGEWAEVGGRSPYVAQAMIHAPLLLSYDKDPETGKITWYNDMSGEFPMSNEKDNLVFNVSNAVHSGFADGIADRPDDLARLLDLSEWYEISDYGRKLSEDWHNMVEKAQREIPLLAARLDFKNFGTGDPVAILGTQIKLLEDAVKWHKRCPNAAQQMLPPPGRLELMIADLRKQLADIQKARRGG